MGTTKKLIVEVVDAKGLAPKDGHGACSPYVQVDFYGQRKRTQTVISDLNPSWNEALDFNVGAHSDVFGDQIEIEVYHDKSYGPTTRHNFLGRVHLTSSQFANVRKGEEALQYFKLAKKHLLSWIQGEIGLKIYHVDEVVLPPPPPAPPSPPRSVKEEAEKPETPPPLPPSDEVEPPIPPPVPEEVKEEPKPEHDTSASPRPPTPRTPPSRTVSGEINPSEMTSTIPEVRVFSSGIRPPALPRTFSTASLESTLSTASTLERPSTFDLVDKMHYIFVRVVKARSLPTAGVPIVKIVISGSSRAVTNPARKSAYFEWDQTFAFGRNEPHEASSILEISVWDLNDPEAPHEFLGGICFDVSEIPLRDPPDSPLAPQWYRLEGGGTQMGDIMLATWLGTQADESFPDASKTDTAGHVNSSKAKVYLSPKLWYLRVTVLEAQDIPPLRESMIHIKAQMGFQVVKTKPVITRNGAPSFNEDLLFVVGEPFNDHLTFTLESRQPKGLVPVGVARVPLAAIERRVDDRKVAAKWVSFEEPQKNKYMGRVQLRLCLDGGYHVMDEPAHVCSDYRPTAKQLWKPAVGTVELGIIGCKNLLPVKSVNGKGSTDAYVVAKYGPKWVRTRTFVDSLDPRWNEQYTWKVYDPCTVLNIGVFDSWQVASESEDDPGARPDLRIGKVRIRISTLQTGRVYRSRYPLMLLTQSGLKKTGEIELAVRFVRNAPTLDVLQVYAQPLFPLMHHLKPLGLGQQEMLRNAAAKILAVHLSRSEPPLRREIVLYMLDADSHVFSMRKVRANWFRIINIIAGIIEMIRWIDDTRTWKNPTATILVHALLVTLVWFPDLIIPTLAFYIFAVGAWNYRFRTRDPLPHFDSKLSLAESLDRDELDEEFDLVPSARPPELVRLRYDKLRTLGARVQTVLADIATQGERLQALVTWRDPRATGIFVGLCFVVAMVLYLVPSKMVAVAAGFYYLRHPMFRDRAPSPALNFFRRLPSLSDRLL